ncbi:MAG: hypothetical protein DRO16_05095, partial [Thermoprotei archaeon]
MSNAFFALLFMTVLVSLAVILPRILFNNTVSGLRSSIGFIMVRYSYSNNTLKLEITNHYSSPIMLTKIIIGNETYLFSKTILPENTARISIPYNVTGKVLDTKITYIVDGQEKTVWKRLFIQ